MVFQIKCKKSTVYVLPGIKLIKEKDCYLDFLHEMHSQNPKHIENTLQLNIVTINSQQI